MAFRDAQPRTIFLKDYRPPDYLIDQTRLRVDLGDEETLVTATLHIHRVEPHPPSLPPLVLAGEQLELRDIKLDGRVLDDSEYRLSNEDLTILSPPAAFTLQTVAAIRPQDNTSLEGLYRSSKMYCTQCEAEGFRKITWYLDRPDVMSEFTTTIAAERDRFPVLLSNGNLIDAGIDDRDQTRHWATWHDPFKKPAYLFAMVAGDLVSIDDSFCSASGRDIRLRIFVEDKDLDKCAHAMRSLKNAMAWDEQVYGREYDLDIFMIVAVDDFNMGAMENKGLNIFNTSCVLAKPETTTDAGFQRVEGVVAHEYFHNWSGNRVTCRDWFQLSLKEGFTVFRDAQFSADMGSATVKRVMDVNLLRTQQFAEDAGPMAHPVQPASFMEISNFYTLTVYEKGAEVVRMIHTLLGEEIFRAGSDLYFVRHDGQAVTIEAFVAAMSDASGRDFDQFMHWYRQAGTPRVDVHGEYDENNHRYILNIKQTCPATPEASNKKPFVIPLRMGLVGEDGDLPLYLDGHVAGASEVILEINERAQSFVFEKLPERPIPSLLRHYSAPVKLNFAYSRDDLMHLLRRDSDGFNRWEAFNQLALGVLEELIDSWLQQRELRVDGRLLEASRHVLTDGDADPAIVALMLSLPSEAYLSEQADIIEVAAIHGAREHVRSVLANALYTEFGEAYRRNIIASPYQANGTQIAQRSLKNMALSYLVKTERAEAIELAARQYDTADNMTDASAALNALVNSAVATAEGYTAKALDNFYQRWRHEPLAINLWLQVQAWCSLPAGLARVRALLVHPAFDIKNPNKVRSVIGAFSGGNSVNFHREDGEGYQFLADCVLELNAINPQMASRLLTPFTRWRKYPQVLAHRMKEQLQRLHSEPTLSKDVYEVVVKSLQ